MFPKSLKKSGEGKPDGGHFLISFLSTTLKEFGSQKLKLPVSI
jgi:hypothetical protein